MEIYLSRKSQIVLSVVFCWELETRPSGYVFLKNMLFSLARKKPAKHRRFKQ